MSYSISGSALRDLIEYLSTQGSANGLPAAISDLLDNLKYAASGPGLTTGSDTASEASDPTPCFSPQKGNPSSYEVSLLLQHKDLVLNLNCHFGTY
jgi:hypothetical protein